MSKLVLEISQKQSLSHNDVIRFNRTTNKWEVVSYKSFNNDLYKERNKLQNEIDELKKEKDNEIKEIKDELKLHKDALKLLTGGEL